MLDLLDTAARDARVRYRVCRARDRPVWRTHAFVRLMQRLVTTLTAVGRTMTADLSQTDRGGCAAAPRMRLGLGGTAAALHRPRPTSRTTSRNARSARGTARWPG